MAAVVRAGEIVWSAGVGTSDVGAPDAVPGPDTAFAVGSITKTFTAALIMNLRDAGALSLGDTVGTHLPEAGGHSGLTIRDLLAHASGLQREPFGDMWDGLEIPGIDQVIAELASAEQVLAPRLRWHYSNLAYAVLGQIGARLHGAPWEDAIATRLLDPLGMTRTGLRPAPPAALGYYADPFADRVHPEPWPDMAAFSAAGGLWSTVGDLARWCTFLCDGHDGVLSAATLEEMTRPEIMADLESWTLAWGLGLQLFRRGERILTGHGGAMPGFLAGIAVSRRDRTGAIVLTNTSADAAPSVLAGDLVIEVLETDPVPAPAWTPGPPVPEELESVLGRWWSEGSPFAFSVRDGALEARVEGQPEDKPPAVFTRVSDDVYRTASGREEGELLRLQRDEHGTVTRMLWATYPFTRNPSTFS